MGTVLGEKLASAIEEKKNDINSFIWKGPKKDVGGKREQNEIKLIDASPNQLQDFYNHCISMLYSKDKLKPGRYILKDIVKDQIQKCNTELYLRWWENRYQHSERKIYPRHLIHQDLKQMLDNNPDALPKEVWDETPISRVTDIPEEFRDITIANVLDGSIDLLGLFDRRHLSLNFITKLGVWFTPAEMKDLTETDEVGKTRDRLDVIKERLRLNQNTKIKINCKGLSYTELRATLLLKNKKYSELTVDQLVVLRNKVLFRFEEEIDYHISQWLERIRQIKLVANAKGITLVERNDDK